MVLDVVMADDGMVTSSVKGSGQSGAAASGYLKRTGRQGETGLGRTAVVFSQEIKIFHTSIDVGVIFFSSLSDER